MGYLVGALASRWPVTGMPYRLDVSVQGSPHATHVLQAAIAAWNGVSALKLVPDPAKKAVDYVRFVAGPTGSGGLSGLGRVGGRQDVLMDYGWSAAPIALLHEIGHSAGLVHEHQRPDRDNFIKVETIPDTNPKAQGNIGVAHGGVVVGRYDCRSLMHYTADDPYVGVHPSPVLAACTSISNTTGLTLGDRWALAHLAGSRVEILAQQTWGTSWTHLVRYQRGFEEFAIAYSSTVGTAHFDRINENGTTTSLGSTTWSTGWDHLAAIELGNDRYLLVHDSATGTVRIDAIRQDGSGSSNAWHGTWSPGWDSVITLGAAGPQLDHVLVYDRDSGVARLDRVNKGGVSTTNRWQQQWTKGLDTLVPFRIGAGDWRVLAYDVQTGRAEIRRIRPQASSIVGTAAWAPGWTHFAFHPPHPGGYDQFARLLAYNATTGSVHFDRFSDARWEIEVASTLSPGWDLLVPLFLRLPLWGNTGLIAYRRSDGLAHFDRLL